MLRDVFYLGQEVVGVSDQKLNVPLGILFILHLLLWILCFVFCKEELVEKNKILLVRGLPEVEVDVQRLLKMLSCLIQYDQ